MLLIILIVVALFFAVRKKNEKKMIDNYLKRHSLQHSEAPNLSKGLEDFGNRLEESMISQSGESAFLISETTEFGVLESPGGSEKRLDPEYIKSLGEFYLEDMETLIN